jgi:hypothetical protein
MSTGKYYSGLTLLATVISFLILPAKDALVFNLGLLLGLLIIGFGMMEHSLDNNS